MRFLSLYYQSLEYNDFQNFSLFIGQTLVGAVHNSPSYRSNDNNKIISPRSINVVSDDEKKRLDIVPDLGEFQLLEHGPLLYEGIAAALAHYIVDHWESKIIAQLLKRRCSKTNIDSTKVERYCYDLLNNNPWEPLGKKFSDEDRTRRKHKIIDELIPIIEMNTELHLDGYITFRMNSYKQEIKEVIEYAIDEYILDQQYEEFMTLLKYFVQLQETKTDLVHLVQQDGSSFMLFDDQMKPLELKHEHDRIVAEMLETEINIEDIVISSLISASPQEIVVHTKHQDYQVVRSVKAIFGDRATVCKNCPLCHLKQDELMPHH